MTDKDEETDDEGELSLSFPATREEFDAGVESFSNALETIGFTTFSVRHEDGKLRLNATFTAELETDGLMDTITEFIREAFPSEEISHEDPILGTLYYLQDVWEGFEGRVELAGDEVDFMLICSPDGLTPELLQRGQDFVQRWTIWETAIQAEIIRTMLPLYNEHWRSGDPKPQPEPISAQEFWRRLSLDFVHVYPDEPSQIRYDSEEMFGDHGVTVFIDLDGTIECQME